MAKESRQARLLDEESQKTELTGPVTEMVTYLPGEGGPSKTVWGGITFHANVPKELIGNPNGTEREKINAHLIESARMNKFFSIGDTPRPRAKTSLPTTSEEYRSYMIGWLNKAREDRSIEHAEQLIERFAKDRELQTACEVGTDDYAYLSTLFNPRLHQLAKGDELNELQVAALWARHGFNVLPW